MFHFVVVVVADLDDFGREERVLAIAVAAAAVVNSIQLFAVPGFGFERRRRVD